MVKTAERLAEVDDFVEFLRQREQQRLSTNSAAKISEPVFVLDTLSVEKEVR